MWGTHDALRANKGYRVLRFLLTNVLNCALFLRDNKNGNEAISIVTALKTVAKNNAVRIRFWFYYLALNFSFSIQQIKNDF